MIAAPLIEGEIQFNFLAGGSVSASKGGSLLASAEVSAQRSADEMTRIADEIELELQYPTQNVREILDNPQTERECRAFLAAFVQLARAKLGNIS